MSGNLCRPFAAESRAAALVENGCVATAPAGVRQNSKATEVGNIGCWLWSPCLSRSRRCARARVAMSYVGKLPLVPALWSQ